MDLFGFIITRHVNSEKTNNYWNQSVKLIRTLYPLAKIVIIDDNSNYKFVKADFDYKNVEIIQSEFPKRGELLPYYYYLKYKFFKNAVIIHDSVFFHKRIPFEKMNNIQVLPLWHFNADTENLSNTKRIIQNLQNKLSIEDKISLENPLYGIGLSHNKWYGCFGVQSYINLKFLELIENKYRITKLISKVHCRSDRCCLERIFGCIFFTEYNKISNQKSLFGDIMKYHRWGYTYDEYINGFKINQVPKHIVKVWTGR
jgi:hypothetical protein